MSLASELQRRNVLKVGAAYAVVAWLLIQVAATVAPQLGLPEWAPRLVTLLLMLGFPIALLLAWFLERTAEGLRVEPASIGTRRMVGLAVLLALFALGWAVRDARNRPDAAPEEKGSESVSGPRAAASTTDSQPESDSDPFSPDPDPAPASIAVLPFVNLGGKVEDEYFSDGMTEELLNVLARNTALQVAARTSVFQFKDEGGDVREIGRTLGVGHIVEGSVRRDGERVRITAQLIRVADGFHVWSESFDREIGSVFELQDEIAQRLAEQLKSTLGGDSPLQARASVDPQAYDDFLKARALYRDRRNILKALQLFRSAVARDPGFAAAWANLALACEVAAYHTTATQQQLAGDRVACMQETIARATELAPTAAITLHARANLARAEGRLLDAERHYLESIARDATYPDVREDYAELLANVGRLADGAEQALALVRLEPSSPLFWHRLLVVAYLADDSELVDAVVAKVASIDPAYFWALTTPFRQALCHGRMDEARAALERAYAAIPDATATLWFLFRWSQGDAGMDDRLARELLRTTFYNDGYSLAAAAGDADLYFEIVANPRDRDKRFDSFRQLACPSNAAMLTDARAHAFLREAGFEAYWREKGWPPQCQPLGDSDFECSPAPFEPLPAAAREVIMPAGSKGP
jgi:TolB-like protein/Tfp pilus assembly protein PilF